MWSVSFLLSLLLCACGQKPEKAILGKWFSVGKDGHPIEFYSDYTWSNSSDSSDSGDWTFLDDGRLKISQGGEMLVWNVEFVDDQLHLTSGGKWQPFSRVEGVEVVNWLPEEFRRKGQF
jgi:hypothetical protein